MTKPGGDIRLPDPSTEAVNAPASRELYAARKKVHPQRVSGTFRNIKWAVMALALAVYYLLPWVRWDRGPGAPDQAVLLDMPARKFYFFFIEIWPQEFYYVTGLLVLAALTLFLMTAIAGRVWCGFMCPQTVWTDLMVWVERFVEGDRNARIRLDKAPWTAGKVAKKALKHSIWLLIGAATGGAWIFYFADAPTLATQLVTGTAPLVAWASLAFFTASTWLLGGIAREQVCTYMCPWPRIQGALFDDESLLVTYKTDRGEPRGALKKGVKAADRGDCVDCKLCVAVCPMGIDIRDGAQLECITCGLCIDACNSMMDKVGLPRHLIAYESERAIEARQQGTGFKFRLIRPRTILYATLIAIVGGLMLGRLVTRADLQLDVIRDRQPLFVRLSDGGIRNGYTLKIINKAHKIRDIEIRFEGLDGLEIRREKTALDSGAVVRVGPDSVHEVKFYAILPASRSVDLEDGSTDIEIYAHDRATGASAEEDSHFKGPKS